MPKFIFLVLFVCTQSLATPYHPEREEDGRKRIYKHKTFDTNNRIFSNSTPTLNAIRYELGIYLDPKAAQMGVEESIELQSTQDLNSLQLDGANKIKIISAKINDMAVTPTQADDTVSITLPEQLKGKGPWNLFIEYSLDLKQLGPTILKETEFSTISEPLLAREWLVSVDRPDNKAFYELIIVAPLGWKSLSNGKLLYHKATETHEIYNWRLDEPMPTYLFSIVSIKDAQIYEEQWQGLHLSYWSSKSNFEAMTHVMKDTPKMMSYFDKNLMRYPYVKYAASSVDSFPGAMEHTTATTFGTGTFAQEDFSTALHELAHHWFGDWVTCRYWDDLWLNEGFATFFEFDYLRQTGTKEDYWQIVDSYRQSYLSEEDKSGPLGPIVNYTNSPDAKFNSVTYNKGGLVLNYLRTLIGDNAFFKGLQNYLTDTRLAKGTATTAELQAHLENAAGTSLDEFFKQYVYREGYPDLKIKILSSGQIEIQQTQTNKWGDYSLRIPVLIKTNGKSILTPYWVSNSSTINFNPEGVEYVQVDPEFDIPGKVEIEMPEGYAQNLLKDEAAHPRQLTAAFNVLKSNFTLQNLEQIFNETNSKPLKGEVLKVLFEKYPTDYVVSTYTKEIASTSKTIQFAALNALQSLKAPDARLQNEKQHIFAVLNKTKNIYDLMIPLVAVAANHQLQGIVEIIHKNIQNSIDVGMSFYYGNMLRSLVVVIGENALNQYAKNFELPYYNFRARTAWGLAPLKSDKLVDYILSALLKEFEYSDYKIEDYYAANKMLEALVEIHTAKAKQAAEQFIANSQTNYSEDFLKKWAESLKNWSK